MDNINEILNEVKHGRGKLFKLLKSTIFDFNADEFILHDFDRNQLSNENPEINKDKIYNLPELLFSMRKGEGEIKYEGRDYNSCDDDFYNPVYNLCLYNENDWTLVHKLSDYLSKDKNN